MGFFTDTIRDARRQVRSGKQFIQRMIEEPVQEPPAAALSPAPPIEEQPDGALTLYRFQKEGRLVPRKVPIRADTGSMQRRHVDPSSKVERSSESERRVTQPVDNAALLDDTSVIASSRKNGLATGKEDTAHPKRQDPAVNEASSSGLHGMQQQVSDDLNSVESPPGHNDPVDTYSSDNLQRETGERELSRDTGLGTPSESFSIHWSAQQDKDMPTNQMHSAENGLPPAGLSRPALHSTAGQDRKAILAHADLADARPDAAASTASVLETPGNAAHDPLQALESITAAPPGLETADNFTKPDHSEPRVIIGQVDVVVVSSAPMPRRAVPSPDSTGMASRRYWRRL